MFGEDGEDVEEPVMRKRGTAVGIQTEPIEGVDLAKLVKGRLHRGLVLRCAKSIIQI